MRVAVAMVLLGACTGADDGTGDGDGVEGGGLSFARDIEPEFRADCTMCHHANNGHIPDGGLDLNVDPLAAILDVPSTQSQDMVLVEPGDHLYSYLWHKVNGTQSIADGSGSSMPLGGLWTDEQIQLLADWIDGGAQP